MRRTPVLVLAVALALVAAACTPWSQLGGGPARTGRTGTAPAIDLAAVAGGALVERWTGPTGPVSVPPVVSGDQVFVVTEDAPVMGGPALLAYARGASACAPGATATCAPTWMTPLAAPAFGLALVGDAVAVTAAEGIGSGPPYPAQQGLVVVPQAVGPHCSGPGTPVCDPEWVADLPVPSAPAVAGERIVVVALDDLGSTRVAAFDLVPSTCDPGCQPAWISDALVPAGLPPWGVAVAGRTAWVGEGAEDPDPAALLGYPLDGSGCGPAGPGLVCDPVKAVELPQDPIGLPSVVGGSLLSFTQDPSADPPSDGFALHAIDLLGCPGVVCAVGWSAPAPVVAGGAHAGWAGDGRLMATGDGAWVVYDVAGCAAADLDDCLELLGRPEGVPGGPMATAGDVAFVGNAGDGTTYPILPVAGGVHAFDPSGGMGCGQPEPPLGGLVYDLCEPVWSALAGTPVTVTPIPAGDELHVVAGGELHVFGPAGT